MACNCGRNRTRAQAGTTVTAGTYRVMVNGRQVYESANKDAAGTVASRFDSAKILAPGETA